MKVEKCSGAVPNGPKQLSWSELSSLTEEGIYKLSSDAGMSETYFIVLILSQKATVLYFAYGTLSPANPGSWASYKFEKTDKKLCMEVR